MDRTLAASKDRHSKMMGPLEEEILTALWDKGRLSGRAIFKEVHAERDIALTTVLTVLERLAKKGFVKKLKGETVYTYEAALNKEDFAKKLSANVFKGLFEISASGAAASFVDALATLDPKELERLSSIIEKKKKELGKKRG